MLEILWDTFDTDSQGLIMASQVNLLGQPVFYAWSNEGVLGLTDPNAHAGLRDDQQ